MMSYYYAKGEYPNPEQYYTEIQNTLPNSEGRHGELLQKQSICEFRNITLSKC